MLFVNRRQAGTVLAGLLKHYADRPDVLVLALPRGGVPVAFEVAQSLNAPLDVFVVRKLGVPGHDELAMGAIATGGVRVLNNDVVEYLALSDDVIDGVMAREIKELERRERIYRGDYTPPVVHGHTVILVDDGLATGSTIRAAITALRKQQPARIVVAVPVASPEAYEGWSGGRRNRLRRDAAGVPGRRPLVPGFLQTSDEEVHELLTSAGLGDFMIGPRQMTNSTDPALVEPAK
jgi:predicted phosphoribosyltransferase